MDEWGRGEHAKVGQDPPPRWLIGFCLPWASEEFRSQEMTLDRTSDVEVPVSCLIWFRGWIKNDSLQFGSCHVLCHRYRKYTTVIISCVIKQTFRSGNLATNVNLMIWKCICLKVIHKWSSWMTFIIMFRDICQTLHVLNELFCFYILCLHCDNNQTSSSALN